MASWTKRAAPLAALAAQRGWPPVARCRGLGLQKASQERAGVLGAPPCPALPAQRIEVENIASLHREYLREDFARIRSHGVDPTLMGILAETSDEPARNYAEWTQRACEENGVTFRLHEVSHARALETVRSACENPGIHGLMIYYPCLAGANTPTREPISGMPAPGRVRGDGGACAGVGGVGGAGDAEVRAHESALTDDVLRNLVPVRKDVEALSSWYQDALYRSIRTLETLPAALNHPHPPPPAASKCLVPCAPLAVVKILEHLGLYNPALQTGAGLTGQCITVVNRSRVVGKPLAAMLANDGAAVYSIDLDAVYAHDRSAAYAVPLSAEQAVRQASVVILGVPSPSFRMPCEWISPGTVVINVAAQPNVCEDSVLAIPGVRYVPKIGRMTVAMLQRNFARLLHNFHLPAHARKGLDARRL